MIVLQQLIFRRGAFSLEIPSARFTSRATGLLGPSGTGKTTLLDLLAGLQKPAGGRVELAGTPVSDSATRLFVPPRLRKIGYVPQDLALFPHLSVRANLMYGCTSQGRAELQHVTETLEIDTLLAREISALSGGERQRVAFARAMLASPRLLLLDEPLSSLNTRLKRRMLGMLARVRDEFSIPLVYVTHDAREAVLLCGDAIIMEEGRIVAQGSPESVLTDIGW